jgi:hypothetical protein
MRLNPFNTVLCAIFTLLVYTEGIAGWPVFSPPTSVEVNSLITRDNCLPGYGKIISSNKIRINSHYIPSDETWYWISRDNEQCKKLPPVGQALRYDTFSQTWRFSGSEIFIGYGTALDKNLFTFVFTIPEPYWDCGPFVGTTPPLEIGCAQDTYTK